MTLQLWNQAHAPPLNYFQKESGNHQRVPYCFVPWVSNEDCVRVVIWISPKQSLLPLYSINGFLVYWGAIKCVDRCLEERFFLHHYHIWEELSGWVIQGLLHLTTQVTEEDAEMYFLGTLQIKTDHKLHNLVSAFTVPVDVPQNAFKYICLAIWSLSSLGCKISPVGTGWLCTVSSEFIVEEGDAAWGVPNRSDEPPPEEALISAHCLDNFCPVSNLPFQTTPFWATTLAVGMQGIITD